MVILEDIKQIGISSVDTCCEHNQVWLDKTIHVLLTSEILEKFR